MLTQLTPPGEEPLALADLKFFLRVSGEESDTLIADMARAAREHVEAMTGLALITQSWRLVLDRWSDKPIALLRPPVQAISEVSVLDGSGTWQVLEEGDYTLAQDHPARLILNTVAPGPAVPVGGIRIDFTAGFGAADDVPDTLKQAIRLLTAHYHERRQPYAETRIEAVPASVGSLLAPWREVRL